ncbi:hypothetical protein CPC08DRAFT_725806 [Agrocybe pediades]|nr:hypothetical protein CPC08DRAFT_725806 [Agrocybe pediades]
MYSYASLAQHHQAIFEAQRRAMMMRAPWPYAWPIGLLPIPGRRCEICGLCFALHEFTRHWETHRELVEERRRIREWPREECGVDGCKIMISTYNGHINAHRRRHNKGTVDQTPGDNEISLQPVAPLKAVAAASDTPQTEEPQEEPTAQAETVSPKTDGNVTTVAKPKPNPNRAQHWCREYPTSAQPINGQKSFYPDPYSRYNSTHGPSRQASFKKEPLPVHGKWARKTY